PVVFLGLTTTSVAAEQLARAFDFIGTPGPGGAMRMANEIQGPVPPFGAVFAVATTYLLLQVVRLSRLLDLHEILARAVTVALAALALVLMQGGLVIWTESLPSYRIHGTFQIFLVAIVFLTVYDPVRARVEGWITAQLNDPGARLERTLAQVEQGLAAVITLDGLDRELLGRLHDSGRAPLVSLYLWDPEGAAYQLTRQRGDAETPLLRAIPGGPFTDGLRDEAGATVRADVARILHRSHLDQEALQHRLRTLEAMDADLTLPLRAGEIILGWVNLKAEPGTDGFSSEEVRRLTSTVDRASILIQNIRSFEQLKEQGRLAALGEMAAGMAHEIRNPLASIKGAAQYLEAVAEDGSAEERDFLDIIVDEVDRLDGVVTQFLDYSGTVRLHPEPTELPRLVKRALDQVGMAELPDGVELTFDVPEP
ncbi:MAG: histidine kinase dimerization/phospho-acceptor domain-containing protein, partial [Myxococcota bacterium]|nr:histidine kinase dimerization/phospho-acceptor domain-containing protein [Myxococcota bacterium]